jgi:putative ABC transport system permease protein
MLEHYIVQALRSFWRFRITAAVNLLGLVLAVVSFIAAYLYVDSLARADMHFPKAERIYVLTQELWKDASTRIVPLIPQVGPPAAAALRAEFPGLEAVARAIALGPQGAVTDDRKADVQVAAVDPEFLKIFDFDFKAGDPATALNGTHSAILTERTAEQLFGTKQVLGRRIVLQTQVEVTVTGVIAAVPQPTHMGDVPPPGLAFGVLVPMQLMKEWKSNGWVGVPVDPEAPGAWGADIYKTYVLFPANGSFTPQQLISQLDAFAAHRANIPGADFHSKFGAVPLSGIRMAYLEATVGNNAMSLTAMVFVLAAVILLIACANYANLSVAIATTRAKEVGVRKVLGASRLHLIRQYLIEAGLLGFAAITIVVLFSVLIIEPINRALDVNFTLASLLKPQMWLMVAGLLAAISLMGGLYPALVLSHVRPADALRAGTVRTGPRFVPTILVGAQFAAASFLLVVALVMAYQNRMVKAQALDTARDPVVYIAKDLNELKISIDALREELLRNPAIKSVSTIRAEPWQSGGWHITLARGTEAGASHGDTIFNQVGDDFFSTIGLKVLAGRTLDREHGDELVSFFGPQPPGKQWSLVIDRALSQQLGWLNPNDAVNQVAYGIGGGPNAIPFRIVGVVEDGYPRLVGPNTASNMYGLSRDAGLPLIRISKENVPSTVKYIDSVWDTVAPKSPMRREFMDALFDGAYRAFSTINWVLNALAVFAFFIAVMGLCGLAIHVTNRRKREIGIRKTLGATVRGVVTMLLIDFAKPVLIANVIAWPFAWIVGQRYMEQFTQRESLTAWPFVLSLLITVAIAWASVGLQAMRAATVKPANVLYAE